MTGALSIDTGTYDRLSRQVRACTFGHFRRFSRIASLLRCLRSVVMPLFHRLGCCRLSAPAIMSRIALDGILRCRKIRLTSMFRLEYASTVG